MEAGSVWRIPGYRLEKSSARKASVALIRKGAALLPPGLHFMRGENLAGNMLRLIQAVVE